MIERNADLDMEFEDEPIEVETPKRAGGVISVRRNPDEMWELREETRLTGERVGTLIRESALAVIRTRKLLRQGADTTMQSPSGALSTFWYEPNEWHGQSDTSVLAVDRSVTSFQLAVDLGEGRGNIMIFDPERTMTL